jgi:hypothetical protein
MMRARPTAYRQRTIPYVILRRQTFFAVLEIPATLRPYFGKVRFMATLETSDPKLAARRAAPMVAAWRREIAEARGDKDDAAFFARALAKAKPTPKEIPRGEPQPGQQFPYRPSVIGEGELLRGTVAEVHGMMDDAAQHEFIEGDKFARYLSEWQAKAKADGITEKTLGMMAMDVRRFEKAFPRIDKVSREEVQRWAVGLMEPGPDAITAKTVRRIVSALRGYWKYLRAIKVAPDAEPFTGLDLPKSGGRARKSDQRQAFAPEDIVKLMRAADQELRDVIDIGRWTGMRIEEICSL